ncbi:MAG: DUF5658 family protein [Ktedonobacterales bacterium]
MIRTAPLYPARRDGRNARAAWGKELLPGGLHPAASTRPFVVARAAPPRAAHPVAPPRAARPHASGALLLALALFALLNAGDIVSTFVGLQGGLREGNPLMSVLLMRYGFSALIAYKLLVIGVVAAGVFLLRDLHLRVAHVTMWICNLLVLGVVLSNIVQYAALR